MVVFYDFTRWIADLRFAAFCGAFAAFVLWWPSWFGCGTCCGFGLIVGCDLIWVCLIDVKLRVLGLVML